jgi:predicted phosphodiesterase
MEKKILIIPDVHGRSFWRSAVASGDYDKIIFLGDYVDPYPDERIGELTALHGLMDIIDFYDRHPDQVVLLLGNHDLHYLSPHFHDLSPCERYDEGQSDILHFLFTKGDRFNLAHEETVGSQKYLFTHAGVNQPWLKRNLKVIRQPDAIHLNRLLLFDEGIETLRQVGLLRWGMYLTGSVVWGDSEELAVSDPLPDVYQIVGHTRQYDGKPIITPHYACLDCSTAFVLDEEGLKPLSKNT